MHGMYLVVYTAKDMRGNVTLKLLQNPNLRAYKGLLSPDKIPLISNILIFHSNSVDLSN